MGLLGIDRCCFVFKCNEVWARPAKKGSLCLIGNTANLRLRLMCKARSMTQIMGNGFRYLKRTHFS